MNPGIVIAARLGTWGEGETEASLSPVPGPRLGLLPAPSPEAALPGLMRSLRIHLRLLDAVITAALLPSQPLPLAGAGRPQAAGMVTWPWQPGGRLGVAGGGQDPPSRPGAAQRGPGRWQSWLNTGH